MIEELTSFEIKKIFGDDLEKSTYKLLYDFIIDLQKQFSAMGVDVETFKVELKSTITDKIKSELNNLLSTGDLQEIINNKLASRFREVINARKNFGSLGERLESIDTQIDKKASKTDLANISNGTPLFAANVSSMTDTTRNYVNTTDGYLYVYSNGAFQKTSVLYQSLGIQDKSITPVKTDFFGYEDIMSQENIITGAINSVGTINTSSPAFSSDYIPVEEGETIYIPGKITCLGYYNRNKTSLASKLPVLQKLNNAEIKIPTNTDKVKYIRISWSSNESSEYYRVASDIKIYKTDTIKLLKNFEDNSISASAIKDLDLISNDNSNIYLEYISQYKTLCIYMKTKEKNSYLRYKFVKMTADYNPDESSSNYNIWRLRGVEIFTKNSDNTFTKSYEDSLIHEASEWECAIKETGKPDFVGGSTHGDEFIDSITFIVDGKLYTDVNSLNGLVCKELRIIRKSKLYRANENSSVHIADHYVDYLFKNNEITIDNRVNWKVDTNCGISYLCMLGARRLNGNVQITNKAIKQGDGKILDVSNEGHTNTTTTKRCTKAYLWNDGSNGGLNVTMSVEILDNNFFPNFNFKFDNRKEYNKFYFDQCGTNFEVKTGDIWYNKALYKIDYYGRYNN